MPLIMPPVEHVQQPQSGECLAACVAMVLNFIGAPVAYRRLVKILEVVPDVGTPSFKVQNVERLGIHVHYQRGSIAQLHSHLTVVSLVLFLYKPKICRIATMTLRMPLCWLVWMMIIAM